MNDKNTEKKSVLTPFIEYFAFLEGVYKVVIAFIAVAVGFNAYADFSVTHILITQVGLISLGIIFMITAKILSLRKRKAEKKAKKQADEQAECERERAIQLAAIKERNANFKKQNILERKNNE